MYIIYHIFNGNIFHLTPKIIRDTINNLHKLSSNNNVQHFFVIVMAGEKMLYDTNNIKSYEQMFSELGYCQYKIIYTYYQYIRYILSFNNQDRIVYHSIALPKVFMLTNILLTIFKRELIRKSTFVSWGSDYIINEYTLKTRLVSFLKRQVYNQFNRFVTLSTEDKKEAQTMYPNANVVFLSYISPKVQLLNKFDKIDDKIDIMVSHSGWPHNNHIESFNLLKRYSGKIRIMCPLCYGDVQYIETVISIGMKYFGKDFHYFTELLPRAEYLELHRRMDIYMSSASVQTGLGAIFCAMESGSKIFVRDNLFKSLTALSYKLYHTDELKHMSYDELSTPLSTDDALFNINNRNNLISEDSNILEQWRIIFEE